MSRTLIIISGIIWLYWATGCSGTEADKLRFLERGNQAYEKKDYDKALFFYKEALLKDSTFAEAWNNKGLALMQLQRYDAAIEAFNQALAYKAGYGEALLNNIKANLAVRQYFAALDLTDRLDRVWPDSAIVAFTRGLVYVDMGKPEKALPAFHQALAADSSNAEILTNIANIHYHRQRYDSARYYLQKSLQTDADLPETYNILAMVNMATGKQQAALEAIKMALSFDDDNAYYLNNLGYILLQSGDLAGAEQAIVQSMKIDPYNAWVYRNMGLLMFARQDYRQAVHYLRKAYEMDKTIVGLPVALVRALLAAGNRQAACDLLQELPPGPQVVELQKSCR